VAAIQKYVSLIIWVFVVAAITSCTGATPSPTPTILMAPATVRLSFATGATFGIAKGTLQPSQSQTYMLEAMQGQPMITMVDSLNHNVTFGVTRKNGAVLLDVSQAQTAW